MAYKVEKFEYNGFCVKAPKGGWNQIADYTAEFIEWTNDPGVAKCTCSDGKERLIPSCCLKNDDTLPEQTYTKKVLFGQPSES